MYQLDAFPTGTQVRVKPEYQSSKNLHGIDHTTPGVVTQVNRAGTVFTYTVRFGERYIKLTHGCLEQAV